MAEDKNRPDQSQGEIVIYQAEDGLTKVECRFVDETVWLTQQQMAELFHTSRSNIVEHIGHIYEEGELDEVSTCRKFRQVRMEGNRQVTRELPFYNLDMIISLGYRVKSLIATQFRRWATELLKEYMIKGFTMDDERLKNLGGGNYWRELLERMPPFMGGGDMVDTVTFAKTTYAPVPLKFEAGTANFVGAIGLGEAVKFMQRFDPAEIEAHEEALLHRATERLEGIGGLRIYGTAPGKCAILSFNVEGVHPYDMGMILDKLGIAVRTGQHCAEPVMDHYGTTGMCRASFALYNTLAEADALAAGVERAVKMLRN